MKNNYLAPLGLAAVGALFGIGHFGGLHESLFGSDNDYEGIDSYYESSYENSSASEYGSEISFRGSGDHCSGTVGCDCSGFSPITNGEEWQKSYCKYCGHKKSCHH